MHFSRCSTLGGPSHMDPVWTTQPPPRVFARLPRYPTVTSGPLQVLTSGIRHPHFQVLWLSISNRAT
ncbi:hypothetical protein CORC01_09369 [Colletotrichum orchidophilum]|uniref:Uncharacterized protein n=1 Tax=Colletotrichum orchidophilum TaxID=1209926 RepID=A0A1G4B1R0_9PEZI|nr:uncharacterized protein CORC01_09369 [Colletotrichum orchidophilum]OHE95358.1 hypothetical protein CORC01_09369 [Colletotrichum orchidophilum]